MDTQQGLKLCPFCGSEAEVYISAQQDKLRVQVECDRCHTYKERTETGRNDLNTFRWLIKETVMDWNTRPIAEIKNSTTEINLNECSIDYRFFDDCVVLHTAQGPATVKREWFAKTCAEVDKLYEESQMWDWVEQDDGYKCDNCGFVTEHAFKKCPHCGQQMRNGVVDLE